MHESYGSYGPLHIYKVTGRELEAGDVVVDDNRMMVVIRGYHNPNINQMALDVDDGRVDGDGEAIGPYRKYVSVTKEFVILRAKV